MKWFIEKRNYFILLVILLLCFCIFFKKNTDSFIKSYDFKDGVITVIIYDNINKIEVDKKIKSIYDYYEKHEIVLNNKFKELYFDGLDDIVESSYVTEKVLNYFKKENINKYLINENGNIIAGKGVNRKYVLSINAPKTNKILKTVSFENKSMATSEINDKYDSVVVISNDFLTSVILSNYLSKISLEQGMSTADKYNCEVLWYYNNEFAMTKKFNDYFV